MLNPRQILIQARDNLEVIDTSGDYFDHVGLVDGHGKKDTVKKLVNFFSGKNMHKDGTLLKCHDIFKNLNRRVFLEGLLFTFTKEELLTLPEMNEATIDCYVTYFFSLEGLKGFANRNDFLGRIQNEGARNWYQDLSVRSIRDVKFRMTGKTADKIDILESLKDVYKKSLHIFETFSSTDPQKMKQFTDIGMFKSDKTIYDVAFKASANMIRVGELLLKNDKDNKEDFLASWGIEIEGNDPSTFFDQPLSAEASEDIDALMHQVNPVSADPDRRITTDAPKKD